MTKNGLITATNGGIFTVLTEDGTELYACARGNLRKKGELLPGDRVSYTLSDDKNEADGSSCTVETILPRKNALIRPAMANLDFLVITVAVTNPEPDLLTVDKMTAIATHNGITPVLLITKADLDETKAKEFSGIYETCGFPTFLSDNSEQNQAFSDWIFAQKGKLIAFAGASGVGKSTRLRELLPHFSDDIETGNLSERIQRGKNTTRLARIYRLTDEKDSPLPADTPGFTQLDFERFDFMSSDDLPYAFAEFTRYLTGCRYTKCTHTKEDGCNILTAVKEGKIPPSRHRSFLSLYTILKEKEKKKYR